MQISIRENVLEIEIEFKAPVSWIDDLVKSHSARIKIKDVRKTKRINPAELARTLSGETAKDAVIVTDTGNSTVWVARHFRATSGQRFLFSGGLASMGCALPGALSVSLSTGRGRLSR
ncbi:MAG: thiamine pyrophosphate-dependent enzyme [Thermoplasmatales archaeon]|nr:thiamine pyrophosphate-dependent enzyme [Thermoplasmatales archaeon]